MVEPETAHNEPKQSRIVSRVLSPAIRLWLRSQVESVQDLQFQIEGSDRQILSGYIPHVAIAARRAVYQGFHLSQVRLTAEGIQVNLGQVLKGKPLRLLAIVPVSGEALLQQSDLTASLQAPQIASAVTDFLLNLLKTGVASDLAVDLTNPSENPTLTLQDPQILISKDQLTISICLVTATGALIPLSIRTGLLLVGGSRLQLNKPQLLPHLQAKRGLPLTDLQGFEVELGSEVNIQELALEEGQMICRGQINVIPA